MNKLFFMFFLLPFFSSLSHFLFIAIGLSYFLLLCLFPFNSYFACVFSELFSINSFSFLMLVLVVLSMDLLIKFSGGSSYYKFFLLALISVLMYCFFFNSVFIFYIFFELTIIPISLLILGWGYQPEKFSSVLFLALYTISASLPMLLLFLMMGSLGSLDFYFMESVIMFYDQNSVYQNLLVFFMFLVFMVKLPVIGVHFWLPKAHLEASTECSMVLACLMLKLGGYGLSRLSMLYMISGGLMSFMMLVSLSGMIISSYICMVQMDMKMIIAYSSINHMGMVMVCSSWGGNLGSLGSLMGMISHGFSSSCLFMVVGIIYSQYKSRNVFLLKGIFSLNYLITLLMFLLCSSNFGGPFSLNMFSEIIMLLFSFKVLGFLSVFYFSISFLFTMIYNLMIYNVSCHGGFSSKVYISLFISVKNIFLWAYHLFISYLFICFIFLFI